MNRIIIDAAVLLLIVLLVVIPMLSWGGKVQFEGKTRSLGEVRDIIEDRLEAENPGADFEVRTVRNDFRWLKSE